MQTIVLLILIGGLVDQKQLAIIGSVLMLAGIVVFLISLPNFEEVSDLLSFTDKNVFFGSVDSVSIGFWSFPVNIKWRLGYGFIILLLGTIVSFVGAFGEDK